MLPHPLLQEPGETPIMQAMTSLSLTHLDVSPWTVSLLYTIPAPHAWRIPWGEGGHGKSLCVGATRRGSRRACNVRRDHRRLIVSRLHCTVMDVRKIRDYLLPMTHRAARGRASATGPGRGEQNDGTVRPPMERRVQIHKGRGQPC
jgi:hypothetical protein